MSIAPAVPPSMAPGQARPKAPPPSLFALATLIGAAAMTVWSAIGIEFSLAPIRENFANGRAILARFLDPEWSYWSRVVGPMVETLQIAVIAAFIGCILALGTSLLASAVSAPVPVVRVTKPFMSVIRSLPDVAYALIFVAAVGIGPIAGILALILFNLGIVAKLTSESIDAIDPGPLEALDAAGATRWQRARVAIIPQVLPNYLSYCLYVFELNIRASAILGFVGAGGVGELIRLERGRFNYERLTVIILILLLVVLILDIVSQQVRKRLV